MKILVTGSIAYDTIMVFPDRFRNHLLPDQLHILNVCFLTPEMRREYGDADVQDVQLVGEQVVAETVREHHDGVVRNRAGDEYFHCGKKR